MPASDNTPSLQPSILVIFGITGDLSRRKVLPALHNLCRDGLIPDNTKIIGISRREVSHDEIMGIIKDSLAANPSGIDQAALDRLAAWTSMFKLDPVSDADYESLKAKLNQIETESGRCMDRLFYLSIPPQVYAPIIDKLGQHGLNQGCDHQLGQARIMIEKPFGYDVSTAEKLISDTNRVFREEQIFRIDHYLAKETAQNILKFRRHNPVFSKQWNSRHIKRIHVIAKESIGIENRVAFYESVGAMRDLVQSHLMQLLALTAMDMPEHLSSDEVHASKHRFLDSLIPPHGDVLKQVVRGQYDSYRQEVNNPASNTETFVSLVLKSSDPNWHGTEFQLTTGKSLDEKLTKIIVYYGEGGDTNALTFRIQPDEGIDVNLLIEEPGYTNALQEVKMNFSYSQYFDTSGHDAYERVLVDGMRGDHLLFATKSEVMAAWRLLQPVFDYWHNHSQDLVIYPNNGPGPSTTHLNLSYNN